MLGTSECAKKKKTVGAQLFSHKLKVHVSFRLVMIESRHARHEQASNDSVRWMALIPKVKLPRVALQTLYVADTQCTKICQA